MTPATNNALRSTPSTNDKKRVVTMAIEKASNKESVRALYTMGDGKSTETWGSAEVMTC